MGQTDFTTLTITFALAVGGIYGLIYCIDNLCHKDIAAGSA